MLPQLVVTVGLAGLIGVTACAPHRIEDTAPGPPRLGNDLPSFHAPVEVGSEPPATADIEEPTGPLDLRDALALALMSNPELAVFSWELRAREAEILQARARPNPEAALEIENFAGSGEFGGFGGSEITFGVSQVLELGGKRGYRQGVAEQARHLAEWDYEAQRADVFTEVTKNFVALLVAQEQVSLIAELVTVSQQMLDAVTQRVEAGGISPVERGRADVELQTTRIDLESAQRRVQIARQQLSVMWGELSPRFSTARGSIEATLPVPPFDDIVAQIDGNPDLGRWKTEQAQRQAIVALERSQRIPDVQIGIGLRRFATTDDNAFIDAFVAELGFPLPIFDRNQGATQAAERRLAMAGEEHRAASVRIRTRLAVIYEELVQSENELTRLREDILPEATATYESARTAYHRGRMRLTDVLDTQRTLFALRSRYYNTLGTYHQKKADIERLIGAPLVGKEVQR